MNNNSTFIQEKKEIQKPSKEELFNLLKPQCQGDINKASACLEACNNILGNDILLTKCLKEVQ